jgi:hypothetical protein
MERNGTLALEVDRLSTAMGSDDDAERHSLLRLSSPLLLALGLLYLQSALFLAFTTHGLDMPAYLSFHLGTCAATATLGRWWVGVSSAAEDADDNSAMVLQLAACTTLAGPFGCLIAAALLMPRNGGASHAEATAEAATAIDQRSELTRLELLHGSLLDRRLRLDHAHDIRPLFDVMIEGTQIEKLDALSLVSKRYAPALVPALRRAFEDKDGSVRVLAATVMAQQHNAFTKRIGALHSSATASPERADHWSELGQAHLDYAVSGLLEASRVETEASHAAAHLARAADLEPDNAVTQARLNAIGQFTTFQWTGDSCSVQPAQRR